MAFFSKLFKKSPQEPAGEPGSAALSGETDESAAGLETYDFPGEYAQRFDGVDAGESPEQATSGWYTTPPHITLQGDDSAPAGDAFDPGFVGGVFVGTGGSSAGPGEFVIPDLIKSQSAPEGNLAYNLNPALGGQQELVQGEDLDPEMSDDKSSEWFRVGQMPSAGSMGPEAPDLDTKAQFELSSQGHPIGSFAELQGIPTEVKPVDHVDTDEAGSLKQPSPEQAPGGFDGEYVVTDVQHSAGPGGDASGEEWTHEYDFGAGKVAQSDYSFDKPSGDSQAPSGEDSPGLWQINAGAPDAGPGFDGALLAAQDLTSESAGSQGGGLRSDGELVQAAGSQGDGEESPTLVKLSDESAEMTRFAPGEAETPVAADDDIGDDAMADD